ncbi:50S ribosomal protein L18 [Chlamydia muridarum str. Nigg]|jgi:ribosomal protein L18, bacterial type|uniref:Large ribosomal subunit protein uL18 n=2 Tax=Chlamydia muridarum TaxID=83560 RepID=RL18_CHLMU|nr:50S ribosomal protein L18 [Chlamydia muridarum]Q9PJM9.1 RecName: Full=Large ribosomal subunit protein uL18; AltName: Full=50S ribosomal protein L18 [Chlamydia muridarum str. Nigg]UFX24803.1 50S ribosomal protein L18 [Chlamydia trachomatis]AAF39603.1 ribosomal protein L18 [Chlamydia muridarum str. Nigg]AHH23186.1 50S ribosomal protein L18 [Chlamydia muridarum str. Nigg3 CMUT3-5]AHH24112.1 50S ribosomal protein L18 [Chlamydia muridarum str. Nigg CM972]AID38313.1 50S ribosomal protein L18 [Ch
MESSLYKKTSGKARRALRVRKALKGSSLKPRLSVVKTNKHIYVQLIDDVEGKTLASISTLAKISKTSGLTKKNQDNAKALGVKIAELGKSLQVDRIVFDRGAHKYHGVVAMVADGAREGGLQF